MVTKADLDAVEASRAELERKHESFKEKQREFVQKGEIVKKERDELRAAYRTARAPQEMNDAMLAKSIREAEEATEKEVAKRMAKELEDREIARQINKKEETEYMRELNAKDILLRNQNEELVRKDDQLTAMRAILAFKEQELDEANNDVEKFSTQQMYTHNELLDANLKYAELQRTVRDHLDKRSALEESLDNLKKMLD